MAAEERFPFGKNWSDYIKTYLSDERVEVSKRHMLDFLGLSDLAGKTFLDIGCGSGLHSLAAFRSGAKEIFAFDYDAESVEATRYCHAHAGSPAHWRITRGSVLDEAFMATVPQADIVYSWGVLHHTGDVWRAIRNAAGRVPAGGLFYIALYSADVQKPPYTADFWLDVKRRYLKSSWLGRRAWEGWYIYRFMLGGALKRLPQFFRRRAEHRRNRGMDIMTDIRDWLGGWPMEFVYDADAIKFCEELGMTLQRIKTGEANTEFLFRRMRTADA